MQLHTYFDSATNTLTYIVWDEKTRDTVIIDPVLDYDPASSQVSINSVKQLVDFIRQNDLRPLMVLETHAHADHLSGAQILKRHFPHIRVAIGNNIIRVQKTFKSIYNLPADFPTDGGQFDFLIQDNQTFDVGSLTIRALSTPGHTPACMSYVIGDAVFTGDALFMPDYGSGRCDFPNGDARQLYHSITQKLFKLPDSTRVFVGHDYQPNGRELRFESTIGEEKRQNKHLATTIGEEEFVKFRTERDRTLNAPRLLLPSIQVNINAGHLPRPEGNGISYLKIPIRQKEE